MLLNTLRARRQQPCSVLPNAATPPSNNKRDYHMLQCRSAEFETGQCLSPTQANKLGASRLGSIDLCQLAGVVRETRRNKL